MNKTIGLQCLVNRNKGNSVKIEENHPVLNFPFIILENKSDSQVKIMKKNVNLIDSYTKKDQICHFERKKRLSSFFQK